jgi:hypothetical protein
MAWSSGLACWRRPVWRALLRACLRPPTRRLPRASCRRAGRQGDAVEKFTELTFGQGAVEFIDQLTLKQHLDGWNTADAEVLGEFRVFVGIDHGEQEAALVFFGQLFQQGLEHLARLAPRCPEVDDDRHRFSGLDSLGFEILDGRVKSKFGHGGACLN